MDAAHTHFGKAVLFLATALLTVVPGYAQTPSFNLNSNNSNLATVSPSPSTAAAVNVAGTMDGTTPITFAPSAVSYATGDPVWLVVSSSGPNVTPVTLYFGIGAQAGQLQEGLHTATMTLTASSPGGVTAATITITYYTNAANPGSGTVIPSSTALVLSAASGSSTSTTITLTTASATSISFTAAPVTTAGGNWLTATANTYSVSSASYAVLTIGASAVGLSSGTYYGTVTITPSGGGTASQISVTFTVPVTITTTSLPYGIVGVPYSATLSATGGTPPYTWTMNTSINTSGGHPLFPLPPGLNLSAAAGLISGTPSAANYEYGLSYPYQLFQVTDSKGASATAALSLVVYNPLVIVPRPLLQGTVGAPYVECMQVEGGLLPSGSATVTISSGSLPAGLTLSPATLACPDGNMQSWYGIVGTPTQSGTFPQVISATDGLQVVTQSMTIVIAPMPAVVVSPGSLAFQYQFGGAAAAAQMVSLTIPGGTVATYSISASTDSGGGWLQVPSVVQSPTGGTKTFQVSASTATNQAGTFTGKITISSPQVSNSPVTVPVTFTVTAAPNLIVGTPSLGFSYSSGATASQDTISVSSSQGTLAYTAAASTTSGGNWLSVTPPSGTTPSNVSVLANPAGLPVGNYTGSILISASTTTSGVSPYPATNSPQTVTVTMTIAQSSALAVSPTALSFAYQTGGPAPNGQALTISGGGAAALSFAATASAYSGGNWLSVSPSSGTTPASLAISVNPVGLATGTYSGSITISATGASNSPQSISVTLTVSASPILTVGQSTLGFSYQTGSSLPSGQNVSVVGSGTAMAFSASATTTSGGNWLLVTPSGGTTPANLSISVNPVGLTAGTYSGNVTISSTGASNSPQSISVTLTVTSAATISISPSLLNFAYQSGGNLPQVQTVIVSATSAAAFTAAASGGSWLAVSPASGTTPASLSVSVNPAGLSPATYNGTVTVTGANGAQGTSTANVTLAVTASLPPSPSINAVTNAASYATGAVSPGELVTIFGTSIGPVAAASAMTDPATGKLATTIGGVQVLFNGTAAPMIYASSTQVSAVVPYEMASVVSPSVWIKYAGQTSNVYQASSATTAPGLFTQNASGSGPGAILNQDNSVNGPGNGAAKGSILQVYMTGEGQTRPGGVTGAITTATLPAPQVTPAPVLAVGVTINGQPALYVYAGEAPGLVAGMMQLNVQIPANAASGDLPILVSVGGNTSQTGVTVSVQ